MSPEPTGERTLPGLRSENYWFRRHEAAYRRTMRLIGGGVVIDAGCGEGYGAATLARRGRVLGLDLDPPTIVSARHRYPAAWFAVGDLCRLPVGAADAIVALQVIEHLWCPAEFLALSVRALAPDGVLIVSTPNARTFPTGRNPSHAHEYAPEELRGLLASGFTEVELTGLRHGMLLRRLDRALGEDVQRALIRRPYEDQPRWLRATLGAIRARHFVSGPPDAALDLIGVCRGPRPLPSTP